MKKLLLLLSLLCGANQLFAQNVKWGVKGGVNFAKLLQSTNQQSTSTSTITYANENLTGFQAGIITNIEFKNFSIEPGLFYIKKGGTMTSTFVNPIANLASVNKITLNYIALPVNLLYNYKFKGGKFFIGGGPYAAIGISGKYTSTLSGSMSNFNGGQTSVSQNSSGALSFGSNTTDYKTLDMGIGFLGGVSLTNGLLLSIDYSFGLKNISHSTTATLKNQVLGISAGYFLPIGK